MHDSVLSEKAAKGMAYVNHAANGATVASREKRWEENIRANKPHYSGETATLRGLTAFIVCAGPSLDKNAAELKNIGRLGIIVCVDAAFRHLTGLGIVPDYCMAIDSDSRCLTFIEGLDTSRTTLACMTSGSPEVISAWKGPRYFVSGIGGGTDAAEKAFAMSRKVVLLENLKAGHELDITKDVKVEFPGVLATVNCGGNVSTAAWSFAYEILRACKVVFVGADFSWTDAGFYAGGHYDHLSKERKTVERIMSHPDSNGGEVHTNLSFSSFKNYHENRAVQYFNTHVNASEGGILGIGDGGNCKGKSLPGWEFLTLKEAIEKYTIRPEVLCPA